MFLRILSAKKQYRLRSSSPFLRATVALALVLSMDNLRALHGHWGIFCRKDLKIVLCAPPKCGSTAIFNALSAVGVVDGPDLSKYRNTNEYLHELKIHPYVRDILPGVEELGSCFSDSSYLKVLVVRDPLELSLIHIS